MLPEKGNPYLKCLDWACGHCEAFWKSCILFFMESSAWVISTLIQPLEKGCWDTLWLRHSLSLLPVCGCWRSWGGGELSQSCTSGLRESLGLNQGFPCPSLIQEPLTPCGNWRFTDLPNHWSWKRLLRIYSPSPCSKQDLYSRFLRSMSSWVFVFLHRWRLHNLSEQPAPGCTLNLVC